MKADEEADPACRGHWPKGTRILYGGRTGTLREARDGVAGIEHGVWFDDAIAGSGLLFVPAREVSIAFDAIAFAILSVGLAGVTKELLAELAAHFTVLPVTDRFDAPVLSIGEHPRVLGDLLRVELRNDGAELWGIVALKEAFLRQLVGGEVRPDQRVAALLRRAATLRLAVSFMKSGATVAHARLREVVLENVPAMPVTARLKA